MENPKRKTAEVNPKLRLGSSCVALLNVHCKEKGETLVGTRWGVGRFTHRCLSIKRRRSRAVKYSFPSHAIVHFNIVAPAICFAKGFQAFSVTDMALYPLYPRFSRDTMDPGMPI